MRRQEDGEVQHPLPGADQSVDLARRDGVEPGGRLVEEEDVRVQRKGAGDGHALGHAAGNLRRQLVGVFYRQPHHAEFGERHIRIHGVGAMEIFAHGKLHVFP